jgi:hypothetical protein
MSPRWSLGNNPNRHRGSRNWLAMAALAALAMSLMHNLDHIVNQQDGAWPPVGVAGTLAYISTGGTLWLALRDDPLAPLAGLLTGLATAIGFGAIHLAPEWSALSDSYSATDVNGLSYAIVYLSIASGLTLAAVSLSEFFDRRTRAA